ncbi:MAG: hypothetical protein JSS11_16920 [Verrucomicrobia bacterium]|nr:hypothetical protein [Verrucomicrobiota bacterium]
MLDQQSYQSGFAIFRPCIFEGAVPACYDGKNYPFVFVTELEAQREIADTQLTRIQEFLDGQRDFDDAISTDEFVVPVKVWPDGRITAENGTTFGKID